MSLWSARARGCHCDHIGLQSPSPAAAATEISSRSESLGPGKGENAVRHSLNGRKPSTKRFFLTGWRGKLRMDWRHRMISRRRIAILQRRGSRHDPLIALGRGTRMALWLIRRLIEAAFGTPRAGRNARHGGSARSDRRSVARLSRKLISDIGCAQDHQGFEAFVTALASAMILRAR